MQYAISVSKVRVLKYTVKNNKLQELYEDSFIKAPFTLDEFKKYIHKKDKARFSIVLERLLSGKMTQANGMYLILDTKTEKYKYQELYYNTISGHDFKPKSLIITIKDINKNHQLMNQLEDSRRWLEMITQATDITVWNYSTYDKKFTYSNQNVYDEFRPIHISDIIENIHPSDKGSAETLTDVFRKRKNMPFNIEMRIDMSRGKKSWGNVTVYGLPMSFDENGHVLTYSGYTINVTEKYELIKELERVTALSEKSESMKEEFVSNISHYIRTPLNSIMGFSQIIGQCSSDEERDLCIKTISNNNDELLRYLNNLLEYSGIAAQYFTIEHEKIDMSNLITLAVNNAESRNENHIPIKSNMPANKFIISWDRGKMEKILSRLMNNAIRFTKEGEINLNYYDTTEGIVIECNFTGADTNAGDGDEIFNSFDKPDFNDSMYSLELCLCKITCEKANGIMTVETNRKTYTKFTLHIPCHIIDVED